MSVAVVGAGAWGTALAKLFADKSESVTLWCREEEVAASIRERRVNETFLPGIELPEGLVPSVVLEDAAAAELVVVAVPSQFLRRVMEALAPHLGSGQRLVSATKGLEEDTLLRMSEVIDAVLPGASRELTVISGPTFAREVADGEPSAIVAASHAPDAAAHVQARLSGPGFRVYTNEDVVGVEIGGSLKNVMALAVGVATGLGLGYNPRAALMSRGLAEMSRLAVAMGGRRETLLGLSGVGDLVLTCTGELSRNRTVGVALGKGQRLPKILEGMAQVAEGVRTTHAAVALARKHGVDTPIAFQMERLLTGEVTAPRAMTELLARPLRAE